MPRAQGGRAAAGAAGAVAPAWTAEEAGLQQPADDGRSIFYTHTLCPYAEREFAGAQLACWQHPARLPSPRDAGSQQHSRKSACPCLPSGVWLALLEKQVPFHLVHIDLSSKPAWYRRVNPRGLVPAVQHAGQVRVESADVCAWIDGAFQGPALAPADPALRQRMQELMRGPCSGAVSAGLELCAGARVGAVAYGCGLGSTLLCTPSSHARPAWRNPALLAGRGRSWGIGSGQSAAQKAALDQQLGQLAAALEQHGGPFLLGSCVSLADILVAPFIRRFAVAAPLIGYDCRAVGGGAIGRWLDALHVRPSGAAAAADSELLLAAFRQHQSLDFFDYDTYATFQLHPQNAHLLG